MTGQDRNLDSIKVFKRKCLCVKLLKHDSLSRTDSLLPTCFSTQRRYIFIEIQISVNI